MRVEVQLYSFLDQGHISMILNPCSDTIGLKEVWHSRANLWWQLDAQGTVTLYFSQNRSLRDQDGLGSGKWLLEGQKQNEQHNKDATQKKRYCMFGGQQEVRYLELSPYSLTLPPKMLTSLISWPQLNKLLMVRPQHASHRGVGGVRGMWHSRMNRPQSEEWSMLDVGAVSWALASRIDLHAMPIYMWHQRYNGTVEISPVEELQRPMGISSDLPCFNMSSLRHCWWYQCTKVCHSLTEEFQQ